MAHEIRTPLTLIKSPLENVLASAHLDENIKDDLEIMDLNTNRLLDLVNQLLDFRKTETKGFKLNFMDYNLSGLLQAIYKRFTSLARERGLRFTIESIDDLHASIDKEGFTKIISNLFTNAIKYSDTYIHVKLRLDKSSNLLILSVEMMEQLFQRMSVKRFLNLLSNIMKKILMCKVLVLDLHWLVL